MDISVDLDVYFAQHGTLFAHGVSENSVSEAVRNLIRQKT